MIEGLLKDVIYETTALHKRAKEVIFDHMGDKMIIEEYIILSYRNQTRKKLNIEESRPTKFKPTASKSVVLGSSSLLHSNREELGNHFKGHALGFWNFQENKYP